MNKMLIKSLQWTNRVWVESDTIHQALAMFPKVETVKLAISADLIKADPLIPIELPALRCLSLQGHTIDILKHFFGARNLIEISLSGSECFFPCAENNTVIPIQFLRQQIALKKLTINNISVACNLFSADHSFQFRLNSLNLILHENPVRKSFWS